MPMVRHEQQGRGRPQPDRQRDAKPPEVAGSVARSLHGRLARVHDHPVDVDRDDDGRCDQRPRRDQVPHRHAAHPRGGDARGSAQPGAQVRGRARAPVRPRDDGRREEAAVAPFGQQPFLLFGAHLSLLRDRDGERHVGLAPQLRAEVRRVGIADPDGGAHRVPPHRRRSPLLPRRARRRGARQRGRDPRAVDLPPA